jgi:phosphoglycolate phosphatase
VPVVGVDFGYTEIPLAQLNPDRLIGSFAELPPAVLDLLSGLHSR